MNPYIASLKNYLAAQSPSYGFQDAHSILDMLYRFYTTENPIDNPGIRSQFHALDRILSQLTLQENEEVFSLTVDLCLSHERQAFLDGIQVGMRLFTELSNLPHTTP